MSDHDAKSHPSIDETPSDQPSARAAPDSPERRRFLAQAGAGGALLALGALAPWRSRPLPAAAAEEPRLAYPGKEGLHVHSLQPLNLEPPAGMLDEEITPTARHFVRNHGVTPQVELGQYRLVVDGEVEHPLTLTFDELSRGFEVVTLPALIECGGDGRGYFDPPVRGAQWRRGAIACAEWSGVRLRDLLKAAGLKSSAVYLGNYGLDDSLNPAKVERFSRGIPIDKALEENTLVAFRMNGQPIPAEHGFPVRLVVPGWIGSCSQKWLTRIWVRDRVHDSEKMTGSSYRVPARPVAPGAEVPAGDFAIATVWPVKSLITAPADGAALTAGRPIEIRGAAWVGEGEVSKVELSFDFGRRWATVDRLHPRRAKYAWYRWDSRWVPPATGYYEIWVRAWDQQGDTQPPIQPWNPGGYLGNVIHRVPVQVGAA